MKKISLILAMILFCFNFNLFAGEWQLGANTNIDRVEYKGIMLDKGDYMIVSGISSGEVTPTCEIYNHITGEWSFTGSLNIGRYGFNLVKLQNGKIMVIGYASSCEIYDPNTGEWSFTDSLTYQRAYFASIVLENGNVLTTAGLDGQNRKTCEIYDIQSQAWRLTSSLNEPRSSHTLTLLPDGRVLAAGDENSKICEIFDPVNETWEITDSLIAGRRQEGETVTLKNGLILFISGLGNTLPLESCEIFDSNTETWSLAGSLQTGRVCFGFALLPNGDVLVNGGLTDGSATIQSCELYNPDTDTWTQEPDMTYFRANFANGLLLDGRVIAAAGRYGSGPISKSSEIYTWNYTPEIENIDYPDQIEIGQSIDITFTVSDPNQDSISYRIDFGDSTTLNWSDLAQPGNFEVSHTYQDTGEYVLRIQAADQWYFENPQTHNSLSNWTENLILVVNDAVSPQGNNLNAIKIFPNPFEKALKIDFNQSFSRRKRIKIYNLLGKLVFAKDIENQKEFIWNPSSNQHSGVYFVKVLVKDRTITKKVLLLK